MVALNKKIKTHWYLIIILVIGIFITIPQIHHHITIIGADGLFHFNRIYDTAMQIKNHNFSYFIQLYGFSNSGRMVTSVYSPLITYIFGGILLICGSFYKFEIVTRFLFFILSGLSMNYALKMGKMKNQFMIQLVCIMYAFSPALIRWDAAQNFTSIGAMLIPLVVGCGIRMVNNKDEPINWVQLGTIMAVVVQTHLATAIQSVFLLVIYATIALIINRASRKNLLKNGIYAVLLCISLSLNVVAGMFELYNGNYIVPIAKFGFVDGKGIYNILQTSSGKWVNLFFILAVSSTLLFFFKKIPLAMKITGFLSLTLFLCSTTIIIDWPTIMHDSAVFSSLLQFPARLVGPATVLALITVASIGDFEYTNFFIKQIRNGLILALLLFLVVNMRSNFRYNRSTSHNVLISKSTTIPYIGRDPKTLKHITYLMKQPLNEQDINYITKSTSDYMPANHSIDNSAYWDYNNKIIQPTKNKNYKKEVAQHKIIVTWKGNGTYDNPPVAYYKNNHFKLNGLPVIPRSSGGIIKVPKVKGKIGKNVMEVTYTPKKVSVMMLWIAMLSWISMVFYVFIRLFRQVKRSFLFSN